MSVNGVLEIDGLDHATADAGFPVNALTVVTGVGGVVTDFSVIWGADGLPPLDAAIGLQGFPYPGAGAIATGTDSNGAIGVAKSFTLLNDAGTLWGTTSGNVVLADGFWSQDLRVFVSNIAGTRRVRIDILALELSDFDPSLSDSPEDLTYENLSWDDDEQLGSVDLVWNYNGSENPDGYIITRNGGIVGTKPKGTNPERYTDRPRVPGTYTYCVRAYKYNPPKVSACSNTVGPTFGPGGDSPDINVTYDGALAFEWNSVMAFITDPSGIYTMVVGKTHDTLYNRGIETSVDVKIPDPFIKTAFVPEE